MVWAPVKDEELPPSDLLLLLQRSQSMKSSAVKSCLQYSDGDRWILMRVRAAASTRSVENHTDDQSREDRKWGYAETPVPISDHKSYVESGP